ncbi:MAG: tRNA (adenosine(37)-N6)-threonylcarbamoyltransferase complex transferase subunit TsaD [Patescibacteria group bacterium]|jgi:N6-L-threonylcarbamoyladenine synthase
MTHIDTEKKYIILGIESSCDETAAAVVTGDGVNPPVILSNIVSSQVDLHAKTGGIVPEVASRAHMEAIVPVVAEALLQAGFSDHPDIQGAINSLHHKISHIAVTSGPGLIGSLLVGFNAAKSLAYACDLPIVPIHHIEGHIYSAAAEEIQNPKSKIQSKDPTAQNRKEQNKQGTIHDTCYLLREISFPALALVVSGGHTSLILMRDHGKYEIIGQTLDDAAGEAFDKVAKLLGIGYPGGPAVSKLAGKYRTSQAAARNAVSFPRPLLNDGTFNFSFSGLKTAVLREVREKSHLSADLKASIAAAFEDAAVDVLVAKTMKAVQKYEPITIILAGGVAANTHLRHSLANAVNSLEIKPDLYVPPIHLCGDNAAMIALAGYYHAVKGDVKSWNQVTIDSNMAL